MPLAEATPAPPGMAGAPSSEETIAAAAPAEVVARLIAQTDPQARSRLLAEALRRA